MVATEPDDEKSSEKPRIDEALETGLISDATAGRAGASRPPRHHIFPRSERVWFEARRVEIDRYTLPLDAGTHQALHYGGGPGRGGGFWNDEIMGRLMAIESIMGRRLSPR